MRLADKSFECLRLKQADLALDTKGGLEIVHYLLLKPLDFAVALKQRCVNKLNTDFKCI